MPRLAANLSMLFGEVPFLARFAAAAKAGFAAVELQFPYEYPLDDLRARAPMPAGAVIRILTGGNAGRELPLVKALTTIGRPGDQVAVITRRPSGYFIAHVEGDVFPSVNGANIGSSAHSLKDKDVIELAGVQMEFVNATAA